MLKAVIGQRVNVTSASIAGPKLPLYLAGARVVEVVPVLPLIGNVPLGVGALSYAGTFNIAVVCDKAAYPDIEIFASSVRDELHVLGMSIHPPSSRPSADVLPAPGRSVSDPPLASVGRRNSP